MEFRDDPESPGTLDLGAFSISLTVADLEVSRDFYAALGFVVTGGGLDDNYLILRNGHAVIGLFSGMFDRNILTFNPGLSPSVGQLESFTDVREIQAHLREQGIELTETADPDSTGPAHITLVDPDGNPILIDQFL
ncbi:VOC family protein [Euzebya sp.]|uniref:VOC family protein n=1 Tax=Euzebya sp. TaxID=1971409 RepID=UPI0035182F1B